MVAVVGSEEPTTATAVHRKGSRNMSGSSQPEQVRRADAALGIVAPGFEGVAEAFEANFAERDELGAAFSAVVDGEVVADLWGGLADSRSGRPWERDTAAVIFSGTKALVALCLLMLADRGELDLDAPVCAYWPEFAANGKEGVRVLELASHQGRLPTVHTPVSERDFLDAQALAARLAQQPQEQDPRAIPFIYHAFTFGCLCGELIRRVDGRTVGRFFAEEVAAPLGLDAWIGIDPRIESRVARLEYGRDWCLAEDLAEGSADDELKSGIGANPVVFPISDLDLPWNRPDWHQAEIPSAGGIGTARALARMFGALARGGELDGVRLVSEALLTRARRRLAGGPDPFGGDSPPLSFGIGFQVQSEVPLYGPPASAFGHTGAGGSVHGAWPRERVGYSYLMNQLRHREFPDPRAAALLEALHRAVHGR